MAKLRNQNRPQMIAEAKHAIKRLMDRGDENDIGELLEVFMKWRYAKTNNLDDINDLDSNIFYTKWRMRWANFETVAQMLQENKDLSKLTEKKEVNHDK